MTGADRAPSRRRVFFALWPDEADRAALAGSSAAAVGVCGGRPVPPENFHVTLAFLGAVEERRMAELTTLGAGIAGLQEAAPPGLRFARLEFWRKPGILAAVTDDEPSEVGALAMQLRTATLAAGFLPDLKPFRAHVTVARKVRGGAATALPFVAVGFGCERLALVESTARSGGSLYSVLDSRALGKAGNLRRSR